jgi:hypothetical protein
LSVTSKAGCTDSTSEESKNKSTGTSAVVSSPLPEAGLGIWIQDELIQLSSQTRDSNCTKDYIGIDTTTNETIVPVDPALQAITHTADNEQETKKQQVWLAKVHEAVMPHKLSVRETVDEASDAYDFEVTENVGLKIDRQCEWLAAVRSSMQKYKEQTP